MIISRRLLLPLAFVFVSGGCLYTDIRAPYGYRSATPGEVKTSPDDPLVTGKGCNTTYIYLVAIGDASYAKAVAEAKGNRPDAVLYDMRSDIKINSYLLGLYNRQCTIVTGKLAKP